MFSGLKFISRDQIDEEQFGKEEDTRKYRKKSRSQKGKDRNKKRSSYYSSSDDGLEKMKVSRKKKKWYASDEDLSSSSEESDSEGNCDWDTKKPRSRKREKKMHEDSSQDEGEIRSKNKARSSRKDHRSENDSAYHSEIEQSDRENENRKAAKRNGQKKGKERAGMDNIVEDVMHDDDGGSHSPNRIHIKRKELGLEWMFRPNDDMERKSTTTLDIQPEETPSDEVKKANPKELNPYLKDDGSGYPDDSDVTARGSQLMSSSLVGDGGASWRLKALKRSQEQAAREGRKLEEVVDERWGSVGHLAVTVASARAAPSRAHLHAIKNRKKGFTEEQQPDTYDPNERSSEKDIGQEKLSDVSRRHPKMKVPKLQDSLSWGKQRQKMSTEDTNLISAAISSVNKYANDGSFFDQVMCQQNNDSGTFLGSPYVKCERQANSNLVPLESEKSREEGAVNKPAMSANQLAAKVLQLRMKGKHEEAEKLMKGAETVPVRQATGSESSRPQYESSSSRYIMHDGSARQKKKEEDADMHLAKKIMRNQQYSLSGRADDEYDYDDDARRKNRKKGGSIDRKSTELTHVRRILTQQERCQFCFENPTRPKHIVVAIANFTYLTLPNWEPVVPGHCCILPMQHESATRTVDNNVWDEIRNFKKCLIMMFAKQERDLVFLETVMGLAQQKRHCLIECIPLPREIARQAPVYFKKAIDEAEDEWSQHNAKKLIDTSEKGLRGSIPKDFPYFHVEFGLNKGFVHVIDDERQFESNFGLNVIRGMLHLPAEDIHRRRKHESVETQKKAVASFAQDWESFDWTKQLY